jgi:hypothetical protein
MNLEQRKLNIEKGVKIGGVLVAGFLVAPFIFVAFKGVIGMLLAFGVAEGVVFMTPVIARKFANWRLKALKAEAMRNPVETLQNEYAKKKQALASYKENIAKFSAQVLAFADQVKQYVKDGLEDAQTYVEQLSKMKQLLELRKDKYQEACDMLEEFAKSIERTERKWKMAMAAVAMGEAAGEIEGDLFSKICVETAMDTVAAQLNQSFADLDIALMDDEHQRNEAKSRIQAIELESQPQTVQVKTV